MSTEETKKTILHVEDDELNLLVTKKYLEDLYTVEQAKTSEEALQLLEKSKVDLILMDLALVTETSGLELTKELKSSEKYSHTPIVVLTSYAFDSDRKKSYAAGCDDFIAKPCDKQKLLAKISEYI